MVYVLQGVYNEKQYTPLQLTAESKAQFDAERLKFETEVLGHAVKKSYILYTMGFKMPFPEKPLQFECSIKASNFHNFMYSQAGLLVSQAIVDLIEDMEPGVHQFFPVEFIMKSGPQPAQKYYSLNVCTNLKTLDFEKSKIFKKETNPERRWYFQGQEYLVYPESRVPKVEPPYDLFVIKKQFQNCVIWHEHGVESKGSIFVTDRFYERVLEIGELGAVDVDDYAGEV